MWGDRAPWEEQDDPEWEDDPWGEELTDDEVANDIKDRRDARWPSGQRRSKPELPEIQMARKALSDKGRIKFDKIGTDRYGDIWQVTRRLGEAKPGVVRNDGKVWKFFPSMNFNFTAEELDEICSFLEEL